MSGTNYPGGIDDNTSLPSPGPNSVTNVLGHAGLHDNVNLAIKALETKLGTGASTSSSNTFLAGTGTGTSAFISASAAQTALGLGTLATLNSVSLTTNVTGTLPVANGGTGITSLGSGVATFLGTPTSANLAAAVTNETGSGALVFGTSPALVTPTGIVKGDVGLGNVDNTSDVTKNAATVALTNKTITSATNSVSAITIVNPYKFSAYASSNQSTSANTWTLMNFDTKQYDTSSNFNTTTHLFTVPVSGYYAFSACVVILASGTGAGGVGINVGTFSTVPTYQGALNNNGTNANPQYAVTTPAIQLTAGQTVGAYGYNNSTGGVGSGINFTWFSCFLVSTT